MSSEKYFTLVLRKAVSASNTIRDGLFSDLVKAVKEDPEKEEPKKSPEEGPPSGGKEEMTRTEGRAPRSVYEIIKLLGDDGITFNEIVRIYAQAAGLKPRKVNRTTIRYSLDRMVQSGKIKAFNRSDGQTVFVAAGKKDAKNSEKE